ncbi:MAG TPA: retropepsin-like aspartic protease, partial [Acidobacteriaceae bacterium]|nr:retropepsin-like aspartic protease [Acidobacteriaceae bacterium]
MRCCLWVAERLAICCVFASLAAGLPVKAQQAPAETSQQPGAGSQVQTGSVLGAGNQSLLSRIAALLNDHQYPEIERMVENADGGSLTTQQKQMVRGVLANRENKLEDSVKLLQPLVAELDRKKDAPPAEEKLLRKALAEDYLRLGDFAAANQAYLEMEYRLASSMTQEERDDIELEVKLLPLAIHNPKMTVETGDAFVLPYDRDTLGLTDVPVFVDAESHDWMLDPTAPFNLICRSTARSVGLKVSEESATIHTLTGKPIQVHMTVIPRFTIGTVTYRNMTAFVFNDADYYFPHSTYQVRGVLGYPAVSALGNVTISAEESRIEVQPGENGERVTDGAKFYLDGDQIMAALGKQGQERMYAIDAGGQQTYLTSRWYSEHATDFEGQKMQLVELPGSLHKPPAPAYVADGLTLDIGGTPVLLHYVQVLTQPLDAAAVDDNYGVLGVD